MSYESVWGVGRPRRRLTVWRRGAPATLRRRHWVSWRRREVRSYSAGEHGPDAVGVGDPFGRARGSDDWRQDDERAQREAHREALRRPVRVKAGEQRRERRRAADLADQPSELLGSATHGDREARIRRVAARVARRARDRGRTDGELT